MAEGVFRIKETLGGNRHYIELPNGDDDIHCGDGLEICIGRWEEVPSGEKLVPDHWLSGLYECNLYSDNPKALLYLGPVYPGDDELVCAIPLGTRVRRPERSVR